MPGGNDVIHDGHSQTLDGIRGAECAAYIESTRTTRQSRLRRGASAALTLAHAKWNPQRPRDSRTDDGGLVVTAPGQPAFVQRHRHDQVYGIFVPELKKCASYKGCQGPGKGKLPSIFEPMDGFRQASIIDPKGPGLSEIPLLRKARAAGMAWAFFGHKRQSTLRTKGRHNRSDPLAAVFTE